MCDGQGQPSGRRRQGEVRAFGDHLASAPFRAACRGGRGIFAQRVDREVTDLTAQVFLLVDADVALDAAVVVQPIGAEVMMHSGHLNTP